jgi:hypothetical protein
VRSIVPLALGVLGVLGFAGSAHADEVPVPGDHNAAALLAGATPPPSNQAYLQYGVSFTAEFVAAPGPMCDDAKRPEGTIAAGRAPDCILGGGGGVAFRAGVRGAGPWYFGGAYEISKQDSTKLYRLAILQQLRGEARYYVDTGREWQPFFGGGLGLAGYGDEWSVDTWGIAAHAALGAELQISRFTQLGFGLTYRAIDFQRFTDSSGIERPTGFSHLVGFDVTLEGRDPL